MATYITSENVRIFPSAYRKEYTEGKYNSEENFTNIINSIVDVDSFVISLDTSTGLLKFVIHGYYFEILSFSLQSNPNCWAGIRVEQGNNAIVNYNDSSIHDLDSNNYFYGLVLDSTDPTSNNESNSSYKYYSLQVSSGGKLVNQIKFSSDSIFFKNNKNENLSEYLDGNKQDTLSPGSGIDSSKFNNDKTVQIIQNYRTSLDSMTGGKGSSSKPVFVNGNGEVASISASSGKALTSPSGNNYKYTQAALISEGELMNTGVAFYASTDSPSSSVGKNGDFWFKYS